MTKELLHKMRELDSRTNDGLHIRLLWEPNHGQVAVAVADEKTGERFAFEVRDGDHALDAFHHPFAYTAWRGIDTGSPAGAFRLAGAAAA